MRIKVLFLGLTVFVFLSACDFLRTQGSTNRNNLVDILIFGEGGKQGEGKPPKVFLKGRKSQVCRRGFPDPKVYYLDKENCFDLGKDEAGSESDSNTSSPTTGATEPPQTPNPLTNNNPDSEESNQNFQTKDIGDNWFKIGLAFVNLSKEKEWLIIDHIDFEISGRWGSEPLKSEATIDSSYCESQHPLYIIPPLENLTGRANAVYVYEPAKSKYFNNLTLFIEGLKIPEGPPVDLSGGDTSSSTGPTNRQGGSDRNEDSPASQQEEEPPVFVLDRLPNYQVQGLARGYWINEDCETIHNFEKSFRFALSSSFQN